MLSKFMKSRAAIGTGMTIGLVGLVTGFVLFDPVQLIVSATLIALEVDMWIDSRKEIANAN